MTTGQRLEKLKKAARLVSNQIDIMLDNPGNVEAWEEEVMMLAMAMYCVNDGYQELLRRGFALDIVHE